MVGDDAVRTYLDSTYSLGICCCDYRRLVEVTPPELDQLFGDKLGLRIADPASRLTCKDAGGCGSDDIAVFPRLYDVVAWRWSSPTPS